MICQYYKTLAFIKKVNDNHMQGGGVAGIVILNRCIGELGVQERLMGVNITCTVLGNVISRSTLRSFIV